jgi:hypothetical protein
LFLSFLFFSVFPMPGFLSSLRLSHFIFISFSFSLSIFLSRLSHCFKCNQWKAGWRFTGKILQFLSLADKAQAYADTLLYVHCSLWGKCCYRDFIGYAHCEHEISGKAGWYKQHECLLVSCTAKPKTAISTEVYVSITAVYRCHCLIFFLVTSAYFFPSFLPFSSHFVFLLWQICSFMFLS